VAILGGCARRTSSTARPDPRGASQTFGGARLTPVGGT